MEKTQATSNMESFVVGVFILDLLLEFSFVKTLFILLM